MIRLRTITTLWVALATAGCASGPDYTRPAAPAIDTYTPVPIVLPTPSSTEPQQVLAIGTQAPEAWWQAFGSADLDQVVERARAASPTVESARAVLAEARETLRASRGAYLPQVDLGASATRQNRGVGQSGAATSALHAETVLGVGPVVTFPLDVFGGTRRQVEQRAALVEFQRYQLAAATLALTGNVVTQAVQVASTTEQLAAVAEIVAIDSHTVELAQISAQAGKGAQLDVLSATSQLASDRALLPPLRQQRDVAAHALGVLVGVPPGQWMPPDFTLRQLALPASLPVSLPSVLVRRRPDILAAEAQLHASNAQIGIAAAQMYPSLTLDGSWSRQSTRGLGILDTSVNLWSLAANLTAPVFHGGALSAQKRAAVDAYASQLALYRQVVLQAFGQVADILDALQHDSEALAAEREALDAAQASLNLTTEGYQAGQASFVQVLDAQRLYQQARLGYARLRGQQYLDTVLLYVAMGGTSAHDSP